MRYAVAGGWALDRKHWRKVEGHLIRVFASHGAPTALICGHMYGAERFAMEWAGLHLVPHVTIRTVMPVERSRHFFDHTPQALILFASGSPANVVLRDKFAARLLPIVEIEI